MSNDEPVDEVEISVDAELAAMAKVHKELERLDPSTRARVYDWVGKKWGLDAPSAGAASHTRKAKASINAESEIEDQISQENSFGTFADLCSAASPETDVNKALVAGYWFQVIQHQEDFGSQQCNNELKHFGEPIGNITRAFDNLKAQKLCMQVKKTGNTKQGRKRLKLTHKGVAAVEEMLRE